MKRKGLQRLKELQPTPETSAGLQDASQSAVKETNVSTPTGAVNPFTQGHLTGRTCLQPRPSAVASCETNVAEK